VTKRTEPSGLGRSIGAVVAGFLATALLSTLTDVVMHATGIFPPWGQPMSDGLFVWATVYRAAFTVLGGFITARLAPRKPITHVLVLGAVGIVAASAGALATWNLGPEFGPKWYPIMLVVTALPCVWAGGALVGPSGKILAAR
jgi:peptidoglycan/LPS O-acetylase OafA/YrhL